VVLHFDAMKAPLSTLLLLCAFCAALCAPQATLAQDFTLSGRVIDASTGEYILGATVIVDGASIGPATNTFGFYSLALPSGESRLNFSFIGYETQSRTLNMEGNATLDIELGANVIAVAAAEIEADKSANTESTDLGKVSVGVETIKSLPALLGEVDVLKVIQFLPGIQSAGEGNSGFYVRGGGPDQNLVLVDDAVVYNASHLFGFFSVFNPDAVKDIDVTKGTMPARFGGRISSVLDIGLKEGNAREPIVSGGLGLISSRLTIEAPIVEDTASFIISGRRTYIDVLAKPFVNPESAFAGSGYYFYDLNAKVNWRASRRNQFYLSGYFGQDVFDFRSSAADFGSRIPWGNATVTGRWNHVINDKAFLTTTATYSDYEFAFEARQDSFIFGFRSGIDDRGLKSRLTLYPNVRHTVRAGIEYTYHTFLPTEFYASSNGVDFDLGDAVRNRSHEMGAYIEDEFDITDALRVNAGLRYSAFVQTGPFTRYVPPSEDDPLSATTAPEEIIYGPGDRVSNHGGLEPRLSLRLKTGPRSSFKAGIGRNLQYIHLASLSPTSLPGDIWLPSSDRVDPQEGTQVSAGWFRDFGADRNIEFSFEVYHKWLSNLVAYREGSSPQDNVRNNVDNNLVFGKGSSYGAEFFLKRRRGEWTGWLGYTWSKTDREFADLNNGSPFPSRYDRRHDLSLILEWTLNDRWKFGGTFIYGTGNAITVPAQRYFVDGTLLDVYGPRNGFRMPAYHRADFGATHTPRPKKGKVRHGQWVFSVFNLYNRQNPYFIYFGNDGDLSEGTLDVQAYQVSLFPILPSVTWNFKF
jgi:hypothetical protein